MHACREEVQSVEGQRTMLRAAAKLAEVEADARFQDEQLRRLKAMPEVERPWTIAALSITDHAAVRPLSHPCTTYARFCISQSRVYDGPRSASPNPSGSQGGPMLDSITQGYAC